MTPLNTSRHTTESSSSEPMVKRIRSDSVLALGKKLVDEMGLDQSVDTLGRWMAHYLAAKMEDAEAATGEAREQKMSECSDAILKLWAHRSELPKGKRPFEDFEPVFRALRSLDPDDTTPRYFREVRAEVDQDAENDLTKQWLDLASGLDYTARVLIRYCLAITAREAVDKSRDWVGLAGAVAGEDDIDIRTVQFITDDVDALVSENPDDSEREKIEDLLKRLEAFADFSQTLASHLRGQLEPATP